MRIVRYLNASHVREKEVAYHAYLVTLVDWHVVNYGEKIAGQSHNNIDSTTTSKVCPNRNSETRVISRLTTHETRFDCKQEWQENRVQESQEHNNHKRLKTQLK